MNGKLYLIPSALTQNNASQFLAEDTLKAVFEIKHFIVERAKTARQFLKSIGYPHHFDTIIMRELDKHNDDNTRELLQDCFSGNHVGLISEAGVPGVADPGGIIIKAAHDRGVQIMPLVGPSSLLLALMASGMNGQRFAFHGYLSRNESDLTSELKKLEMESKRDNCTQIFIETPYRNDKMVAALLKILNPNTTVCFASNITAPNQFIQTKSVADWKKQRLSLEKNPTVFLLFSGVLLS